HCASPLLFLPSIASPILPFPDSFQAFLSLLYKHLLFRFFFIYLPEPLMQSFQIPDISLCVICQHPEKREDHRMPDILPSQYRLLFLSIHFKIGRASCRERGWVSGGGGEV